MIRPAARNPAGAIRVRVRFEPAYPLPWAVYRLDWCGLGKNPGNRGVWDHTLASRHATEQAAEAQARVLISPDSNPVED